MVLVGATAFVFTPPRGPRSMRQFQPTRMADLETSMWQAYYAKERVRLFALLTTMLREQYRYSWWGAAHEAFYLARAAATFGDLKDHYDAVLPDLERAYRQARDWTAAAFDPAAVARAELDWWIARRIPGDDSPANVGRLMASEYALLYEVPLDRVARAALLRAEAGRLRDETSRAPDWAEIGALLRASYQALFDGVNERFARA